jgi:hypothetical protein
MEEYSEGLIERMVEARYTEGWRKRDGKIGETRTDEMTVGHNS